MRVHRPPLKWSALTRQWLLAISLTASTLAFGAEPRTEHTYALAEGEQRPAASIEDAAWLAGSWTGTAFGKPFETVWTPPSAGTMVGLFKLMGEEEVDFYEILLLSVQEGSLSLRVKHFTPELVAWEDKEEFINFRLVKKETDALHFGGLSFYRSGPDSMDAYILMRNGEELSEQKLVYTRKPGTAASQ